MSNLPRGGSKRGAMAYGGMDKEGIDLKSHGEAADGASEGVGVKFYEGLERLGLWLSAAPGAALRLSLLEVKL